MRLRFRMILAFLLLSNSVSAQDTPSLGLIIGGFSDFVAGGIVTIGGEYYFLNNTQISPTLLLGYDFTTESWEDGSEGLYQAVLMGFGLRFSSQKRGAGLYFEPLLSYQKLWLTVRDNEGAKVDSGGTLAIKFLYGYRFAFSKRFFGELTAIGGYEFAPVNLKTDPFPYAYEPDRIDWHCWNNPSVFSILNTFIVRFGIYL